MEVDAAPCGWHLRLTFIAPMGFTPANSHVCLTPWSVFQDGSMKAVSAGSQKPLRPLSAKERSFRRIWKTYAPFNREGPHPALSAERLFLSFPFRPL